MPQVVDGLRAIQLVRTHKNDKNLTPFPNLTHLYAH